MLKIIKNNNCKICNTQQQNLPVTELLKKIDFWKTNVQSGQMEFLGGDTDLVNLESEIKKETKFAYNHYFKCNCGKIIQSGISTRSTVGQIKLLKKPPLDL